MKRRKLGPSGIEASVIGLGAWAIGGWTWGGEDEQESIRAIHAFLDAGGDLIDTAPMYGFGRSEEVVGKAIEGRRDQVVLATKCSMRWDLNEEQKRRATHKFTTNEKAIDWSGEPTKDSFDVYIYSGRDGIREEVERSLKRLRTDHIDLYQTHWQIDETPVDERMGALLELKREGKIRAIGVSNATPELIAEYARHGQLDTDQEKYSMLDRDMEKTNLPVCADKGLGFLAYSPLGQGLLTGKITQDREFPDDDLRSHNERFGRANIEKVQAMLEPMREIADSRGISLTQLTMAWTLSRHGCSHVLCGARNEQQARDNAGAGQVELNEDEIEKVTAAVESYDGI
ncbi:MAG: aldo/keto reductase [Planctomycetota bacterium]